MGRKLAAAALLIALLSALSPLTKNHRARAESTSGTLTFEGRDRTYALTVPASYDGSTPVPLIVVLHGAASSGRGMEAISGWDAIAEQEGFLVVYPDSVDVLWDDGRLTNGWYNGLDGTNDIGFIPALIDDLSSQYSIDPDQVYLSGMNSGGAMALRLACEMPDRFAGVAVVDALTWNFHVDECPAASDLVSLLILIGQEDAQYPIEGRDIPTTEPDDPDLRILSSEETLAFWNMRNECNRETVQKIDDSFSKVYPDCADGTTLAFFHIPGMGANWPHMGDYTLNQIGFDTASVMANFFMKREGWDDPLKSAIATPAEPYSGAARSYDLYVPPSTDSADPMPVVFGLHGRSGTGLGFAYLSDMNRVAREKGFIAIYPDGVNNEWDYVLGTPGFEDYSSVDDSDFFVKLVDDLAKDLAIDQDRLYVAGFSNGGFMAQRAACDAPDRFAAFATISASLYPYFIDLCESTPPVPMMVIHGTDDNNILWNGVTVQDFEVSLSVPDTVLFWAVHDQCEPDLVESMVMPSLEPNPTTTVYRYTFGGCAVGSDVLFYAIQGGGHNIPGIRGRLDEAIAGQTTIDINGAEEIWKFFSAHTLSERQP